MGRVLADRVRAADRMGRADLAPADLAPVAAGRMVLGQADRVLVDRVQVAQALADQALAAATRTVQAPAGRGLVVRVAARISAAVGSATRDVEF
jgi:hypothetical protein